ncbi:DUF3226 domain-containing protein [Agitococcus lubricus]|uniref:DUF4435 domain-containing protein n=1 Tax=Agitococcus lubricus TaxID=1077255 RepID=A0A2T5J2H6_9GAMM|nr:DUF3226 domain-containing protein [Agitococcus lubricus]PTQ90719.1 hypothetical protein C8N29_102119 [Agitococcus lubricus]
MMSKKPFKDDKANKLLLLEGINDCHVVAALCEAHKLPQVFKIYDAGGCEDVLVKLMALIDAADGVQDINTIGIVLDADDNLMSTWQSVIDNLAKKDYLIQSELNKNGTILIQQGRPTIGIWLMPNNQINGMLEDFCQILLDNPVALSFIEQCLNQAKTQKIATFKDVHRAKAIIHTYLAWQDELAKPLGQAITAKILNPNHQLALTFKDWLLDLFGGNHASP